MVNVFLPNGELDIYDGQSIDWTYTPIRFTDGITEPYTTDFDIPNNRHNTALLTACGLLDSGNRFGSRLEPANLSSNGVVINVYIQVVGITDDDITIALFEKAIPTDVMSSKLKELVRDDHNSIFDWDLDSDTRTPSVFKRYMYGDFRDWHYAQYHPSMNANSMIDLLSIGSGYNLPHTDPTFWVTATGKTVCPQNRTQVIEIGFSGGDYGKVSGGQHIANDLEWSWSPDQEEIVFDRAANATVQIWVSYGKRAGDQNERYFETILQKEGNFPSQTHITVLPWNGRYRVVHDTYQVANMYIGQGTKLRFRLQGNSALEFANAVVVITYSDYGITDDDYGKELQYVARKPKLVYRDYDAAAASDMLFNGMTYTQQIDIGAYDTVTLPYVSFSYIGFWCNLADTELKDFLWGLAWMTETKFQKRNWDYYFDPAYDSYEIDGEITVIETSNDALGQRNHLLFAGEDEDDANVVSEIDNFWLEPDKAVHESPFAYSLRTLGTWAYFPQYSDNEYDEEKGSYDCRYEDVDGLALSYIDQGTPNLLLRLEIPHFTFDEVTESTTVEIETYDNVARADIVYLHGRKFLVQEIDTDISTGLSTIRAVEIWKRNPSSHHQWPPSVEITNISNINGEGAEISIQITEIQ